MKGKHDEIVLAMYYQGFLYSEICRATGLKTHSAITRIIRRHGEPNRAIIFTEKQVEEMIELWRDGRSDGSIAMKMGLNRHQVRNKLKSLYLVD